MRIAFYKGLKSKKIIDILICIFTLSKYSHCEILFDDNVAVSASFRDNCVRFKQIKMDDKWDIYDLHIITTEQQVMQWFLNHINEKYDLFGAIGCAFKLNLTNKNKKFCSYSCAESLNVYPSIVSPGKLFKILKVNKHII